MSNGSGDFVIAFSTQNKVPHHATSRTQKGEYRSAERSRRSLRDDALSPLFLATVEAVEEAVYNSLLKATTITGRHGRTVEALPIDRLKEILAGRR